MIWQPCSRRDAQVEAWRTPPARLQSQLEFDVQCDGYIWHQKGGRLYQAQAFRTFAHESQARVWGDACGRMTDGTRWRAWRCAVLPSLDAATAWVERMLAGR